MQMLDANEVARRLREAMDSARPPVTGAALADACHVTPQAVNGWRKTGRLHKRHLGTIAKVTGQPLAYFLEEVAVLLTEVSPAEVDPRAGEIAGLFYWLTEEEKIDLLGKVRAKAYGNRALVKEMAGRLSPPSDGHVEKHMPAIHKKARR